MEAPSTIIMIPHTLDIPGIGIGVRNGKDKNVIGNICPLIESLSIKLPIVRFEDFGKARAFSISRDNLANGISSRHS